MAEYEITAPDGHTYRVTAPDDASQDQVLEYAKANYQSAGNQRQVEAPPNPTDGMSGYERVMAGIGRSVNQTWDGLRQVGGAIADAIPGVDLTEYRRRVQADIDETRRLDAPLMATGGGQAGNALGALAQIFTGGTALRGSSLVGTMLPTTVRGNALQGLAMGALAPTATGQSRGLNALEGGVGGAVGGAVGNVVGSGLNGLMRLTRPGISSIDRTAANTLLREATNPAALRTVAPSQVSGVQRTLAEEVLDPGIARLERTLRSTGGQFDAIDRSNNAARVRALESFAQDDVALAAARRERGQQTRALRERSMQDRGVAVDQVRTILDGQIRAAATRPSVQSALLEVQRSLDAAGDDIFSLYGTRKYIDDLLSGKAGGDKSYARAATSELMQIKGELDARMASASPSFSQYLEKYREMSVPINRMEVGQALTGRRSGSAILDPVTGAQVLTPAQFSRASRSLDDVARKATGFPKAKASEILRPGDIATIKSIQDDLERQAFRATAGSGGNSQTFERLGVQERLARGAGREVMRRTPFVGQYVGSLMDVLDRTRNDQLKERLAYLVANPAEARRVLAALPPSGQSIVSKALTQLGGVTGAAAGVTLSSQNQPLERDAVGGASVPL